jgi:hypothetical protein
MPSESDILTVVQSQPGLKGREIAACVQPVQAWANNG